MTKKALLLIILGLVLVTGGLGVIVKAFFFGESKTAVLQINSFPKTEVLLDNTAVGQTPLSLEKLRGGDHLLKLSANISGQAVVFETKIKLTPEALTYINRELGSDRESSAGEILFLEKLAGGNKSEIIIVSEPTGATVKIDGNISGQTPLTLKDVLPSDHEIFLSLTGFKDRFIRGKTVGGYRLNVAVQLAKAVAATPIRQPIATPSAEIQKPYVIIKETPTGWLRVRMEPNTNATEAAKINTGEKFPLILEGDGWDKIRYKDLNEGWVSDAYVTKVK
ncbi:MAG: PEGA domain-containing protein [Patescibacteria group bacterium]